MVQILLLEDDRVIANQIAKELTAKNYSVTHIDSIKKVEVLSLDKFSLAVFDWTLPDGDSLQVVKKMRLENIHIPVLMLTANREIEHRQQAIDVGVNDFLGKPFHFHELLSRIQLLLKESPLNSLKKKPERLECSGIEVLPSEHKVQYRGAEVRLTKKEVELLTFFIKNPDIVFSRNELIDAVWGTDENPSHRTVDTHVLHLRKKIAADLFETVWSMGYRYVPHH